MSKRKKNPRDFETLYHLIKRRIKNDAHLYIDYLECIDATPTLGGIVDVSYNFLNSMEDISSRWEEYKLFSHLIPVAEAIYQLCPNPDKNPNPNLPPHWLLRHFNVKLPSGAWKHAAHNYQGEHPLYTALVLEQKEGYNPNLVANYRFLLMHFLYNYWEWRTERKNIKEKQDLGIIYRSLKLLSKDSEGAMIDLLKKSPNDLCDAWLGKKKVLGFDKYYLDAARQTRLEDVMHSILIMRGDRKKKDGAGGGGGGRSYTVIRQVYEFNMVNMGKNDPPKPLIDEEDDDQLFSLDIDPEDLDNFEEEDIHPVETQVEDIAYGLGSLKGQRAGAWRSKHQLKHIIMANQELPFANQNLSIPEMALIMESISKKFKSASRKIGPLFKKFDDGKISDHLFAEQAIKLMKEIQFAVIVMVQVWLGRSRKDAGYLIDEEQDGLDQDKIQVITKGRKSYWRFKVIKPSSRPLLEPKTGIERKVAEFIVLPDYFGFSGYYKKLRLFSDRAGADHYLNGWIDKKDYPVQIKALFEDIQARHNKRIEPTEVKLSRFLKNQICRAGGDAVDAGMLSGYKPPNTDTQLHYFSPDVASLTEIYSRAVKTTIDKIYQEWPGKPPKKSVSTFSYSKVPGATGVHQCPVKDAIRQLASWLRDKIKSSESAYEKHNYFVAYTVLFCVYNTSYRSVINPLPKFSWMDDHVLIQGEDKRRKEKISVFILSDKDGDASKRKAKKPKSYFNSRFVPVSKDLIKQLHFWEAHHEKLLYKKGIDLDSISKKEREIYEAGELFYFIPCPKTGQIKIQRCQPLYTEMLIGEIFDFKTNSNRRFLRTELRAMGIASEYVNTFMSHWSMGQHPCGVHSSFPTSHYLHTLSRALQVLSNECGWTTVQSPFRKSK